MLIDPALFVFLILDVRCLSLFSVALRRQNLSKKEFNWVCSPRGPVFMMVQPSLVAGNCSSSWALTPLPTNRRQRAHRGCPESFETSKLAPLKHTSFNETTPLNPSQTVQTNWGPSIHAHEPMGPFSFKPSRQAMTSSKSSSQLLRYFHKPFAGIIFLVSMEFLPLPETGQP